MRAPAEAQYVSSDADGGGHGELPADVLEALVDVGRALQAEEIDLDRMLALVVRKAQELLRTDLAWLALLDEDASRVHVVETRGARHRGFDEMEVVLGEGLGGAALRHGQTLVVADYRGWAPPGPVRETMLREGVRSVVCAPILRGDRMVGALYVANRHTTAFAPVHAATVSTLATQASVAIENARLLRSLVTKTRLLEATFEMHRELDATAVADLGVDGVVRRLGELIGRGLILDQQIVAPYVYRVGPGAEQREALDPDLDPPAIAAPDVVADIVPLLAAGTELGRITVLGAAPVTALERNALTHGATVLALALMRHRSAQQVEWRLRGEILDELLRDGGRPSPSVIARAARFGIDLTRPHQLLLVDPGSGSRRAVRGAVQRATLRTERQTPVRVLSAWRGRLHVIALIGDTTDGEALAARLAADEQLVAHGVTIGVSRCGNDVAAGLREATACMTLAARRPEPRIVAYDQIGPLRFMLDVARPENAAGLVRDVLGPIARHDQAGTGELLETLRAFVEEDGHHQRVALRCHIHPSTVKYRLARIGELLDEPLRDAETKFQILLAFRLLDLLDGLGVRPLADVEPEDEGT